MNCCQIRTNHLNYGRKCKSNLDELQKSVQDIIESKEDKNQMELNIDNFHKIFFSEESLKHTGTDPENCFIF